MDSTNTDASARFPKSSTFPHSLMLEKSMGPNPLKLTEELLDAVGIPAGSVVLDLGSGSGLTSALLAREYGFTVFAADLWSEPSDNMRFFESLGLTNTQIIPLKADATALPFATSFFDAVVSIDSYHYFGRDPGFCVQDVIADTAADWIEALWERGGRAVSPLPACIYADEDYGTTTPRSLSADAAPAQR